MLEAQDEVLESEQSVSEKRDSKGILLVEHNDIKGSDRSTWISEKFRILALAHNIWRRVVWNGPQREHFDGLTCIDRVCLSIASLGEYLTKTLNQIATALSREPEHTISCQISATTIECLLLSLAGSRRWCPNKVQDLLKTGHCSASLVWFLLDLDAPSTGHSHSECTSDYCTTLNVKRGTYKTRHISDGCDCAFDQVDPQVLVNIVSQGKIALVNYGSVIEGDGRRPKVTEQLNEVPYIAISDVWAHGLGNQEENALPACALQELQRSVNALDIDPGGDTPFWIDSLCLPRYPVSLRRQAIAGLSEVFENAIGVLVWDSYLRIYDCASMIETEVVARILASDWTTRLWTFSIGRLAKKIWFQFRDKAVDFYKLSQAWLERISSPWATVEPLASVN